MAVEHGDADRSLYLWLRGGELIVKLAVQRFEPGREVDDGFSIGVEGDLPIVDVLHVRRLDKGVQQVPVCRIKGMVDFETTTALRQRPTDVYVANELAGQCTAMAQHAHTVTDANHADALATDTRDTNAR